MAATQKKPRRTAERILEVTLDLFNRFRRAQRLAPRMISRRAEHQPRQSVLPLPGQGRADQLLVPAATSTELGATCWLAADNVRDVEDAWFFLHTLLRADLGSTAFSTAT
jgi:hypothetical protein